MSEMSAANDLAMPQDMTMPPPAPEAGGQVWIVGYVADTNEPVLADTDMADDTTPVWLESTPDQKVDLADLDDRMGEGGVEWLAEPEEYATPEAAPVAGMGMGVGDMLDDIESRLAGLEGVAAGILLDTTEDASYIDGEEAADQVAKVASALAATRDYLAVVAAAGVTAEDEVAADGQDPEQAAETEDEMTRLNKVTERLDKLEATIAGLMKNSVPEAEIMDSGDIDTATIDERQGMTAAAMSSGGKSLSVEARGKAAEKGFALPDGKLPIRNKDELDAAIRLRGKVEGHTAEEIKAHIIKRAADLGAEDMLPAEWQDTKQAGMGKYRCAKTGEMLDVPCATCPNPAGCMA
jgi:hypothetical protein